MNQNLYSQEPAMEVYLCLMSSILLKWKLNLVQMNGLVCTCIGYETLVSKV